MITHTLAICIRLVCACLALVFSSATLPAAEHLRATENARPAQLAPAPPNAAPTGFSSANSTVFAVGVSGSFNVVANGTPPPSYTATGTLPSGVTLTTNGLLSGSPAVGTQGVYPLTITADNGIGSITQNFTLAVVRPTVVTTAIDEDNGSIDPALGTGTSLREAVNFANTQPIPQTITFAPTLAGQSINLTIAPVNIYGPSALRITARMTIQGLTGNSGVTIRPATKGSLRPFFIAADGDLTLNDLTIADGGAQFGGGIFNFNILRMNRCTLRDNVASQTGGALDSGGGGTGQSATLVNCTVANNRAQVFGGGIVNEASSSMSLVNLTICKNVADAASGGIRTAGPLTMVNTIVADNTSASAPSDVESIITPLGATSHHNLIGTGGSGGLVDGVNGNIVGVSNPRLGALAANGGPTATMALLGGAAINAGATVSGVSTDQRGVARPQFGAPDIGAFELVPTPSLVVTTTVDELDATSDPAIGTGTSLREALTYASTLSGAQTITFAPSLAGQTVTLASGWNGIADDTALRVNSGNISIAGSANGVTLAVAVSSPRRHLYVAPGATLSLSNLTLTGGSIPSNAGGAAYSDGTLSVSNCTFANNSGGEAGAIQSTGTLTITGCTFSGNASGFNGGALRLFGATNISGSTFTGNTVANEGGALINFGDLNATNCTFTNNGKHAVLLWDGTADLRHVTVAYNLDGGLLRVNTTTTLRNSIVAGNSGFDLSGTLAAASSNNLLNLSASATGLGALASNGGPTQTIALLPGSPAFNAAIALGDVTVDQRGIARPQAGGADIGAFELVPAQPAAPPLFSPASGTYLNSVTVSLSTASTGAAIRYTTDGSAPSETTGTIYSGPFALSTSATVRAIAVGGGWLPSSVSSATYTVQTPLEAWRALHGLASDGSQDLANPSRDGIANILKYAFNLAPNTGDLSNPNTTVLPANGTAGLPFITRDAQGRLFIEFVRRKATTQPAITYTVETGADLTNLQALALTGATITSIDANWERITITDPTLTPKRFARVRVTVDGVTTSLP